ncbi:MAG: MGMT family protein [Candidatus Methanomethylophilaceae archaeon]
MTELEEAVWARLRQIPPGRVCSYGDLAEAIGRPGNARAMGRLLSKNPEPIVTPCHRVVLSDGRLGGYMGGYERSSQKQELLEIEGVKVLEGVVVDFPRIRFRFPPEGSGP